jgi:hypothetical protein
MKANFIAILLICSIYLQAQSVKEIPANRLKSAIKIDGTLSPEEWKDAALMEDFTQLRPRLNEKETEDQKIKVYISYDNEGIYVGGKVHEKSRADISAELTGRDGFGNNDFVGMVFDTYYDKLNGFEYFVTPLNEQMDAKAITSEDNGEDFSWNAVWKSATSIQDDGWTFEMFIPFAAIRFSEKNIQDWGINIVRMNRKRGEQFFWSPIDPNKNGFLTQEGVWKGLENIKPPLRLQLFPYLSYYLNHFPTQSTTQSPYTNQVNGGLDVKWGINEAFTLDATLIPDFGQVQSDDRVVNLTPFEVRFNENRPFFTEGAELFNKGNLFYSRRIGGTPFNIDKAYSNLGTNEEIMSNPTETKLINATKISGRTQGGLGVAMLNAIANNSFAEIRDNDNQKIRREETSPVTNYNIFVLDQNLKNNSNVSFVNTSVLRFGETQDATVSSGLFNINNKKNSWNISGQLSMSRLWDKESVNGYSQNLSIGKTSGRFNFNIFSSLTDTKFTSNDLGYFTNNNFIDNGIWMGYKWVKPSSWYNNLRMNFNASNSRLYQSIVKGGPMTQGNNFRMNVNGQLKNLWFAGIFTNYTSTMNDYYEPRVGNSYFRLPGSFLYGVFVETNNNKPYSVEVEFAHRTSPQFYNRNIYEISLDNNLRINQKLSFGINTNYLFRKNNVGFSYIDGGQSIFARRNVDVISNSFNAKYNFTNRMGLTLVSRHYFSAIKNKEYFNLKADGNLNSKGDVAASFKDNNANFFNVDMVYTWQFAQGSFLNVVWKNAIGYFNKDLDVNYFSNLSNTLKSDQNNNLSVKMIYFLDYNDVKKAVKK